MDESKLALEADKQLRFDCINLVVMHLPEATSVKKIIETAKTFETYINNG